MPQTFGDARMPFGQFFPYTVQNVEVRDNNYFFTVIYSRQNTEKDQYLRHWMRYHPGLRSVQQQTNFREMTVNDPIYQSSIQNAVPQTPAVLITKPAENGPFGQTVFLAYGNALSADPNVMASQMQAAMRNYEQIQYQPQQTRQLQPRVPQNYCPTPQNQGVSDWLLLGGLIVVLFLVFNRKRRR